MQSKSKQQLINSLRTEICRYRKRYYTQAVAHMMQDEKLFSNHLEAYLDELHRYLPYLFNDPYVEFCMTRYDSEGSDKIYTIRVKGARNCAISKLHFNTDLDTIKVSV